MKTPGYFLVGMASAFALVGGGMLQAAEPLHAATDVDLMRYMGSWQVVGAVRSPAEPGVAGMTQTYKPGDGWRSIIVECSWRDGSGPKKECTLESTVLDRGVNAHWKMKGARELPDKYVILAVDKDYRWAVVGHPSRKYGWVLARNKAVSSPAWERARAVLQENGYDATKLVKVPQTTAPRRDLLVAASGM